MMSFPLTPLVTHLTDLPLRRNSILLSFFRNRIALGNDSLSSLTNESMLSRLTGETFSPRRTCDSSKAHGSLKTVPLSLVIEESLCCSIRLSSGSSGRKIHRRPDEYISGLSVTWYTEIKPTPNAPVVRPPSSRRFEPPATSHIRSKSISLKTASLLTIRASSLISKIIRVAENSPASFFASSAFWISSCASVVIPSKGAELLRQEAKIIDPLGQVCRLRHNRTLWR